LKEKSEEKKEIIPTEKTLYKEPLTDEKRDQIIKELQENLKRLHENKIKAAWEDVPKEIKVIGINDQQEETLIEENQNQEVPIPAEVSGETEKTTETYFQTIVEEKNTNSSEETEVEKTEEINSSKENFTISSLPDTLSRPSIYPIRTEDVIVEIKETEADTDLLIEYINFLEEKRSVFRKNKKKEEAIIDKIIKEDPTIPKLDINNLPDNSIDLASKSITISKGPVSENFAKILSLQGKREKAIEIYEQLILKNPEKKPYFEAQIEKLKNRI
jgi:tetratricopeptide (TPR) repeat protein